MAKNHPLMKDVKNWILDSFSFMDGVGYDILFDDDIYGMENTKAISADIDGLTDFDFEKGKKNLLKSIPNKIKAEFPYLRIVARKDGDYFIMFIVLLDNNDYLEDKNIQYINLNESKKSATKSIKESKEINLIDNVANKLKKITDAYVDTYRGADWISLGKDEYTIKIIYMRNELSIELYKDGDFKDGEVEYASSLSDDDFSVNYIIDFIKNFIKNRNYLKNKISIKESKEFTRNSIKESSDVAEKIASEIDKSYWVDKLIDDLDRHYESMEKAWLKNLDKLSDEDILGIVDDCMGKSKTLVGKSEMLKSKMIDDLSKAYDDYIDDIDRQIRIGKSEDEIKDMIETTLEDDIKMYLKLTYNNKTSSNYFLVKFAEDNLI